MLPLKRILVLACAFSIMAAPPVQTFPTGTGTDTSTAAKSPAPASTEPTTLLGRHYQLSRREPFVLMPDPLLDGALEKSRTKSPEEKQAAAEPMPVPVSESPPPKSKAKGDSGAAPFPGQSTGQYNGYPQDDTRGQAQTQPPPPKSTGRPGNSTSSPAVAARRMVPYPRYRLKRNIEAEAEHESDHYPRMDTNYLSHVGPAPAPAPAGVSASGGAAPVPVGQQQKPTEFAVSNGSKEKKKDGLKVSKVHGY